VQAAEGKDSLPEQERNCRRTALSKGWAETAGPFVISGQPRTGYVNLSDAERDIPALAAMLDTAHRGGFDVLVIYDFTRLRDLIALVSTSLADYNVQIFSLAQAIEPLPPQDFDPLMADAAWFNQAAAGMTSRAEINALRRRFRIGMPGRVTKKGLHPLGRLPYGYRKPPGHETDRQAIPELDPATASAVLAMRDLFLSGKSLTQIAAALDQAGYPTRHGKPWHPDSIRHILRNPFYAGIVTFGTLRRQRDARQGRGSRLVRSTLPVHSGPGKHPALWDDTTRRRILDELQRRGKAYPGARRTARLSGLLVCAVCDRNLWVGYHTWKGHPAGDENRFYRCSSGEPDHPRLTERSLLPRVIDRLTDALQHIEKIQFPAPAEDRLPFLRKRSADLEARRLRLREAYLSGTIPLEEYNQVLTDLRKHQAETADSLARAEDWSTRQAERLESLRSLAGIIGSVPDYLLHADPQQVNASLHQVLRGIRVSTDGGIELDWKN